MFVVSGAFKDCFIRDLSLAAKMSLLEFSLFSALVENLQFNASCCS